MMQDYFESTLDGFTNNRKEPKMALIKLDGIDYEAAPEVINALTKATDSIKALSSDLGKSRADGDTLKSELTSLKSRDIAKEIGSGVQARLNLERNASVCLDGEDVSTKTDSEIKSLIIAKKFPDIKLDGQSADYVNACYSNAVSLITKEKKNDGIRDQRRQSTDPSVHNDADRGDADHARDRYIRRLNRDAGGSYCSDCGAKMKDGECTNKNCPSNK